MKNKKLTIPPINKNPFIIYKINEQIFVRKDDMPLAKRPYKKGDILIDFDGFSRLLVVEKKTFDGFIGYWLAIISL